MMVKVYKFLILFFYNRLTAICKQTTEMPMGIPLKRDPNSICEYYEPCKRGQFTFDDCQTDGHHLCAKCIHNEKNNQ